MCITGPLSLISHKIGAGKKVTSHPVIKDELIAAGKYARFFAVVYTIIQIAHRKTYVLLCDSHIGLHTGGLLSTDSPSNIQVSSLLPA